MANYTLGKVHVFPTEASYNTNKSSVSTTADLALIKASALTSLGTITSASSTIQANGYVKFSNGLIIQWGSNTGQASPGKAITFPTSFPNACLCAVGGAQFPSFGDFWVYDYFTAISKTGITQGCVGATITYYWLALGY